MFKPASSPVFPHLVFLKDVTFGTSQAKTSKTKLYKLDWQGFDSTINDKFQSDWKSVHIPDPEAPIKMPDLWLLSKKDIPIVQIFNKQYEDILQSLLFAVPQNYAEEIRNSTQAAILEWNKERHFDTVIREMCLKPAIKHIEVAFKLLCDCIYDEKTNYFSRTDNKYLLPHVLLFRFWQHQTGSGCIMNNSDFDTLRDKLTYLKKGHPCAPKSFTETDCVKLTNFNMRKDGESGALGKPRFESINVDLAINRVLEEDIVEATLKDKILVRKGCVLNNKIIDKIKKDTKRTRVVVRVKDKSSYDDAMIKEAVNYEAPSKWETECIKKINELENFIWDFERQVKKIDICLDFMRVGTAEIPGNANVSTLKEAVKNVAVNPEGGLTISI